MRRKITLNLDDRFITAMDDERGDVPRSRWIERQRSPLTAHAELEGLHGREAQAALRAIEKTREAPTPKAARSPVRQAEIPLPKIARRHWAP